MIAVVDNYDSFAYNLDQYLGEYSEVEVARYKEPPKHADGVVFSPGPGRPDDHPVMDETLEEMDVPVLGVCLGHQAIARYYGGEVDYADEVVHGKTSTVEHDGKGLFQGLPSPMEAGRYHSLVVTEVSDELDVVARGADEVMAVRHRSEPVYGVQFHPESILTPEGKRLIQNFVEVVREHG